MLKKVLLFLLMSICQPVFADTVTLTTIWAENDIVTNVKLNNNNYALTGALNGGLDNNNANTVGGYRFMEVKSSLPVAGTQGRTVFLTSDNSLNFDTGATFVKAVTPSGSLTTGNIPAYNGGWVQISPGTNKYPLVSTGAASLPAYQQLDLTAGVTSTLPLANGGTGQNLSSTHQGDIYYDGGSNGFTRLTPGTSGQALITGGAGANPAWGAAGALTLVSSTPVSGSATTGNITINSTSYYKIVFQFTSLSAADTVVIRINADTGSNYGYVYNARTSGGALTGGATYVSATSIIPGTAIKNATNRGVNGEFSIYPLQNDSTFMAGKITYGENAGTLPAVSDFMGTYNNGAATSFSMFTIGGATMTGNVYLYKYSLS